MNANITLLTPDFGLVYARAQGVRRSGAKLASALATFAESELILVRGTEQWRIVGAVLNHNWIFQIPNQQARARAVRVCGFLLRLLAGETRDAGLFGILHGFFEALSVLPEDKHEAAEALAVLRILAALGLDTGEISGTMSEYTSSIIADSIKNRAQYITRINRGIAASGL